MLGSIAVNFIGEPQAVHCGPWFCVSSMVAPSVRSPEFPGKPPYESRLHRVARNDFVLYEVALRTLEPSMLKAHGTRTNARQHHARRAARTSRALDGCEGWTGVRMRSHGTSLHLGGSATLSVTDGCLWRDGDRTSMRFRVPQQVVNIAHISKLNRTRDPIQNRVLPIPSLRQATQTECGPYESTELPSLSRIGSSEGWSMPHYFFDIKDGHRLVDPSGLQK